MWFLVLLRNIQQDVSCDYPSLHQSSQVRSWLQHYSSESERRNDTDYILLIQYNRKQLWMCTDVECGWYRGRRRDYGRRSTGMRFTPSNELVCRLTWICEWHNKCFSKYRSQKEELGFAVEIQCYLRLPCPISDLPEAPKPSSAKLSHMIQVATRTSWSFLAPFLVQHVHVLWMRYISTLIPSSLPPLCSVQRCGDLVYFPTTTM